MFSTTYEMLGPVRLEDDAHIRTYLEDGDWRARNQDEGRWNFSADGTFEAQGNIPSFFPDAGPDVRTLRGTSTADTVDLSLSAIQTDAGAPLLDRRIPLTWQDGMLHIGPPPLRPAEPIGRCTHLN